MKILMLLRPLEMLYLCIPMRRAITILLGILCLTLQVMTLHAQTKPGKLARATAQSELSGEWYTDWVTTYHTSFAGFDSMVTAEREDTSTLVMLFDPPRYMLELYPSSYEMARGASPVTLGRRTFRRIVPSRSIKNAVRIIDWERSARTERYHLASVSDRLIDSLTFQTLYRWDSTFDVEGRLRQLRSDSNYVHEQNGQLTWSFSRIDRYYLGTPQWIEKNIRSGTESILTKDSNGKEIIRIVPLSDQVFTHVIALPNGYRASALDIGPAFDTLMIRKPEEAWTLSDLVWKKLPSLETVAMMNGPLYIHDGKFLASYIEQHSGRRGAPIYDTVERILDDQDRLIGIRANSQKISYKYDKQDRLIEIASSYYELPPNRTVMSYESIDGRDLVEYVSEIKSERTREHSFQDSTKTRMIYDIGYPMFDSLHLTIDRVASATIDQGSLTVVLNELPALRLKQIRMELIDQKKKLRSQSIGGVLKAEQLVPGVYVVRYYLDNERLYDQTIVIDKER